MSNKLPKKKIAKMFKSFCEKQTNHYVAQKCKISVTTVKRYRKLDNWDERAAEINKKVEEKLDDDIAEIKSNHIKFVRVIVDKYKKYVEKTETLELTAGEYERLAKLELFLMGEETELIGVKGVVAHNHTFEELKDLGLDGKEQKEFDKLCRKLIERQNQVKSGSLVPKVSEN